MRKEIFIHFAFLTSFLIFVSVIKNWIALSYWPLWIGAFIGTLLPDIDHLIYVYFLKPYEVSSQRVALKLSNRELWDAFDLLAVTRSERKDLVFHTILFQIIFFILSLWVITSSGSLLGRGLVLAFSLHLIIDQIVDIRETGSLSNWLGQLTSFLPQGLDRVQTLILWGINVVILLILGFLL